VEHSAGRAGARERLDGCPDDLAQEAGAPDQHRGDAHPQAPGAWDAWGVVHPDATDAADLRRELADAGVEKLAVQVLDARALNASSLFPRERLPVQPERAGGAVELCRLDAVQSAEQSCAARGTAADLPVTQADVPRLEPEARQELSPEEPIPES
jgi:hypothetical protein